ncbi:hypothetical protein BKA66DRAFT_577430 [Pyrenochaeta sp. MPI-SDFR-AT-0127]|nr:hypothetical protein BKA66DRAFT_577430 [Pyrenochaeta sp. MPI-SDFR-AT-0127]
MGTKLTERCKDWSIKDDYLHVATCRDRDGKEVRSEVGLEQCLKYDNGGLTPTENGHFNKSCNKCFFVQGAQIVKDDLWCVCKNDGDNGQAKNPSAALDEFVSTKDNGNLRYLDHEGSPVRCRRWNARTL